MALSLLLERGADVDTCDSKGDTALIKVIDVGNLGSVESLVAAGASMTAKNEKGWTPLTLAAKLGDDAMVHTLVRDGGAPLVDMTGKYVDPIIEAANHGKCSTAVLLAKLKANVNVVSAGRTALGILLEDFRDAEELASHLVELINGGASIQDCSTDRVTVQRAKLLSKMARRKGAKKGTSIETAASLQAAADMAAELIREEEAEAAAASSKSTKKRNKKKAKKEAAAAQKESAAENKNLDATEDSTGEKSLKDAKESTMSKLNSSTRENANVIKQEQREISLENTSMSPKEEQEVEQDDLLSIPINLSDGSTKHLSLKITQKVGELRAMVAQTLKSGPSDMRLIRSNGTSLQHDDSDLDEDLAEGVSIEYLKLGSPPHSDRGAEAWNVAGKSLKKPVLEFDGVPVPKPKQVWQVGAVAKAAVHSHDETVEDEDVCPLCANELDDTDLSFFPCKCRFQVCLWCYQKVLEDPHLKGQCPACRTPYSEQEPVQIDAETVVRSRKERERIRLERSARKSREEQQAKYAKQHDGWQKPVAVSSFIAAIPRPLPPSPLASDRGQLEAQEALQRATAASEAKQRQVAMQQQQETEWMTQGGSKGKSIGPPGFDIPSPIRKQDAHWPGLTQSSSAFPVLAQPNPPAQLSSYPPPESQLNMDWNSKLVAQQQQLDGFMHKAPESQGQTNPPVIQGASSYSEMHPSENSKVHNALLSASIPVGQARSSRLSNGSWFQQSQGNDKPFWNSEVEEATLPDMHFSNLLGDEAGVSANEELFWQQQQVQQQPSATSYVGDSHQGSMYSPSTRGSNSDRHSAATSSSPLTVMATVGNDESGKKQGEKEDGWEIAGQSKHMKGLQEGDGDQGDFGENLALLLSEQGGDAMNAAKLPAAYLQRFGNKIPLYGGQKLKQLLQSESEKGVCALEEREAGLPPTPVLFVRLLGSRTGLKEGEFTGVAGYMFTCSNDMEQSLLAQSLLVASAKELRSLRRDAGPTTKLFLCNSDTGTVHGPWLPLGEPSLSTLTTSSHGKFPAQLRVRPDPDFPMRSVTANALSWGRQKVPGGILAPRRIEELCQGGVGSSGHIVRSPPGPSYRCKWCGKEGGQPDSHWHQACERHPDNRGGRPSHR